MSLQSPEKDKTLSAHKQGSYTQRQKFILKCDA